MGQGMQQTSQKAVAGDAADGAKATAQSAKDPSCVQGAGEVPARLVQVILGGGVLSL